MMGWKLELVQIVTPVGGEVIGAIDDEAEAVMVSSEATFETIVRIKRVLQQLGINYEVKQLQ